MKPGRFSLIMTLSVILSYMAPGTLFAAFGFGNGEGKSGLDFNSGYDVNTVMIVSGRVASSPSRGEGGHMFVDITTRGETVTLCLGPRSYWEGKDAAISRGDDVTAKGSVAQGNDGRTYLMVQRLSNRTTGARAELRNERGNPAWPGNIRSGGMWNSPSGGWMMQGGGMMRGVGGMMRR